MSPTEWNQTKGQVEQCQLAPTEEVGERLFFILSFFNGTTGAGKGAFWSSTSNNEGFIKTFAPSTCVSVLKMLVSPEFKNSAIESDPVFLTLNCFKV